jgi:hypothetical protein
MKRRQLLKGALLAAVMPSIAIPTIKCDKDLAWIESKLGGPLCDGSMKQYKKHWNGGVCKLNNAKWVYQSIVWYTCHGMVKTTKTNSIWFDAIERNSTIGEDRWCQLFLSTAEV